MGSELSPYAALVGSALEGGEEISPVFHLSARRTPTYSGDKAVRRETSNVSGKNGSNLLCLLLCFPLKCFSR